MTTNPTFAITIGRKVGAGGRSIGRLLATQLGFNYIDREIFNLAAGDSGLSAEIFEQKDERRDFYDFSYRLVLPFFGGIQYYPEPMSDETLFRVQCEAMIKVADKENCLFIGRAADYVLRNHPRCLNIFLTAPESVRIQRVAARDNLSEKEAQKKIEQIERERKTFYNFYSTKKWGDADTYDLCIDTSVLGIPQTAQLIAKYVQLKFPDLKLPCPETQS